jgi:hypothetical protein
MKSILLFGLADCHRQIILQELSRITPELPLNRQDLGPAQAATYLPQVDLHLRQLHQCHQNIPVKIP